MSFFLCVASLLVAPTQAANPITLDAYVASCAGEDPEVVSARWPLTVAEASGFEASSKLEEVEAFLTALESLPAADRLSRAVFGKTTEGRELTVVTVRGAGEGKRERVLINANIHGGEIEGKVAAQILLRELALGYHAELLESLEIAFVPVFNADGNDRISRRNRASQNGPDGGVGERANAGGLDLNRDFVKLETPEVRALTTLIRETAPRVFMDLHTTNGSAHGYDLTYASSLSPNVHPRLSCYMAQSFFPRVRRTLEERDQFHIFDYGNFGYAPRAEGSRGKPGEPIRWSTYDSRPRFGTNLMGLRGTVSILSEAYSYLPYERRVRATYAFVLESLRVLASDADQLEAITDMEAPIAESLAEVCAMPYRRNSLGVEAKLDSVGTLPVRVSSYSEVTVDVDPKAPGVQGMERRIAAPADSAREVSMDVQSRFRAGRECPYGSEFLILEPSAEVLDTLAIHLGEEALRRTGPEAEELTVSAFLVEEASLSDRVFQGHREVSLKGSWGERTLTCPPGALRVTATRLVAHLLHPESDDSMTTWNFFDRELFPAGSQGSDDPDSASPAKVLRTHPVHMIQ